MKAVPDLELAAAQGAPSFSGIGDTLPANLITRVAEVAQLLSAVDEAPVAAALQRGTKDPFRLAESVRDAMQAVLDGAQQAATVLLAQAGVTIEGSNALADPLPATPWRNRELAFAVPLQHWPAAQGALRGWTAEEREATGVRCRIVLVPVEEGEVLPMGIHLDSPLGEVLPLPEDRLETVASALGTPLRGNDTQASLQRPAEQLRAYSYDLVRRANRTGDWAADPDLSEAPAVIARTFADDRADIIAYQNEPGTLTESEQHQLIAAQTMLELCDLVAAEDGRGPGLASGLASIDIRNPALPEDSEAVAKLNFALIAAIEADASSNRSTPVVSP